MKRVCLYGVSVLSLLFLLTTPLRVRAEGLSSTSLKVLPVIGVDSDKDGIMDVEEVTVYHTDPLRPDTDNDGFNDAEEIRNGFSPLRAQLRLETVDTDDDYLSDALELALHTDLGDADTDNDGVSDRNEVYAGRDPLSVLSTTSTVKRSVAVDLDRQQLTYFFNGVKLGTIPVSTGQPKSPTPPGSFKVIRKVPVVHYVGPGYDLPNTKWNLEFKRSFYLHGAYWHNNFGIRTMSHGCVNIAYRDVEKLYAYLQVGDEVTVFGQTPRTKIVNPLTQPTTVELKKTIEQIARQSENGS